jgi:hypothetical protein
MVFMQKHMLFHVSFISQKIRLEPARIPEPEVHARHKKCWQQQKKNAQCVHVHVFQQREGFGCV